VNSLPRHTGYGTMTTDIGLRVQTTNKSNPNHSPYLTTKQHAVVSIQQNIVTCPSYPEKFE